MTVRARTRLTPDARRESILVHAARLFGAHGYPSVSIADVARSAGVTPGLVHHYFDGKRGLFYALLDYLVPQVIDTTRVAGDLSIRGRVEAYIADWLDWVDANRATWLATAGQGEQLPDPEINAAVEAARQGGIDSIIAGYPEALRDTPQVRLMLRSYLGYNRVVLRSWLAGDTSREDAESLLTETLYVLITTVASRLEARPTSTGEACVAG